MALTIAGQFDWMRHDLLAVVGSNFYYKTPTILELGDRRCIWFNRDETGYLQVNFWMPTMTVEPRARILENCWIVSPNAADVECPPSGRRLRVWYANGDQLAIEFFDIPEPSLLSRRYPEARSDRWVEHIQFPTTGVEISEKASGTPIEFDSKMTRFPGVRIRNSFFSGGKGAILIGLPEGIAQPPSDEV